MVMLNITRLPLHLERSPSHFLFIFYINCVNFYSENRFLWLPYNTSFQCMIFRSEHRTNEQFNTGDERRSIPSAGDSADHERWLIYFLFF